MPRQRPDTPVEVRWGADGLAPAVVQDVADGRVLMLGWLDAEALAATLASGEVHFHSRSRGRLWRKGETSGHTLELVGLSLDCDADALLLTVRPTGPACHTNARSCFDAGAHLDRVSPTPTTDRSEWAAAAGPTTEEGFAWLETLWATITDRAAGRPEGSYTARLLAAGVDAAGRKVTEEATEVLIAAKDDAVAERAAADRSGARSALAAEVADLLYHLLVLCAERGLEPLAVIEILRARAGRAAGGARRPSVRGRPG